MSLIYLGVDQSSLQDTAVSLFHSFEDFVNRLLIFGRKGRFRPRSKVYNLCFFVVFLCPKTFFFFRSGTGVFVSVFV